MTQTVRPLDKLAVALALLIGLAAIIGALVSEHAFGLAPCPLCLDQRVPYYWGLPVLAAVLVLWNRLPLVVWYVAIAIAAALFAYNAWLGAYHAGVEWGWWAGPQSCVGVGEAISFDALGDLNSARFVPCDQVQFRFLGISLAGYSALISLGIVALLGFAAFNQFRRYRR
jgi:disulfide bond formation protein DsbB